MRAGKKIWPVQPFRAVTKKPGEACIIFCEGHARCFSTRSFISGALLHLITGEIVIVTPSSMNLSALDRVDTFLNLRWRPPAGRVSKVVQPFVTISRQSGSGGTTLARMLARQLNRDAPREIFWQIFEGNITDTMLKANDLPARIARFLPEDHISEVNASVGELVGLHPSLWELIQKTNATMENLARAGNAILVGRGANFATASVPGGFHVRLVAPPLHRARYMAELYGISEKAALAFNAKREAARRRYVKATFNANVEDPALYDLTLNMSSLSFLDAAKLIADHIQARGTVNSE